MRTARRLLLAMTLLVPSAGHAAGATNFIARLEPIPPFPACQAAAQANGIPWRGMDPLAETGSLAPGNSETALITLHEKGPQSTQWLIYFQVVAVTNAANTSPPKPDDPIVLYTSIGGKFEFTNSPAMLRVRTLGPFVETNFSHSRYQPMLIDKSARITVNQTFLGLGLDGATAAIYRLTNFQHHKPDKVKFYFGISGQAFSPAEISHDRAAAQLMQMTPAEERALAGGIPALYDYFGSVRQTPELDNIMFKVLSLPSVLSLVSNLGLSPGIAIASPRDRVCPLSLPAWNLPSPSPLYALSVAITLNKHPALTLTMIVTAPHPPFLVCGGIVGFLAENPDDPENYLTLRVINAHF
jgi:hypothetical protein